MSNEAGILRRWIELPAVAVPDELQRVTGGHPLVAERLVRAGITTESAVRGFLDPDCYTESDPFDLPDLEIGVERVARAIRNGETILVWGDFDVDGQTATALLYTSLREAGADVRYHVPLRNGEGHGIALNRLREWLGHGVGLIITCDTGISSHEAVEVATSAGVDIVITDHHLPEATLPKARAVINPMRLEPGHPLRELPGVGVAFELIRGLQLRPDCSNLLDLVALGVVADVAILRNETRNLLQRGLDVINGKGHPGGTGRPGLRALIDVAGLRLPDLDESDLGFALGPRLNAQGRLGDARDGVELLATDDPVRAAELASQLEGMNARRRLESRLVEESALALLDREPSLLDYAAIVLAHAEWSGGVVGIVANRLAELHQRPVILLGEKDGLLAGSARSVAGCNITEALGACSDLLARYGGHTMAAGVALPSANLFEFRRRFSIAIRERIPADGGRRSLLIDGTIDLGQINSDFALELRRLAPFGNGNPPPVFVSRDLRVVRRRKLGRRGDHLQLLVEDRAGRRLSAIWWKAGQIEIPPGRLNLAWNLTFNRFQRPPGQPPELQLEILDLQPLEESVSVHSGDGDGPPGLEIEDLRLHPDAEGKLAEVRSLHPEAIVWREGATTVEGLRRNELSPSPTLVIWTTPPGPIELKRVLERVKPRKLVIFNQSPPEPTLDQLLRQLGSRLKFVISSRRGETSLEELAGSMARREMEIRYALEWFAAHGQINFDLRPNGTVTIAQANTGRRSDDGTIERLLRSSLEETAAYRRTAPLAGQPDEADLTSRPAPIDQT